MRALGEDGVGALEVVVWGENGARDELAAVGWHGGLVDGWARIMAWTIVVHKTVAGVWPAVASLISVNHLNRSDCPGSEE